MDNTKANENAMKLLNERFRLWINIGCAAHALDLFMKDVTKAAKCKGVASVLEKARLMANAINDSTHVKVLLHKLQVQHYKQVQQIHVNAPTRFATMYIVAADLLKSQSAIKAMRAHDEWQTASSGLSADSAGVFEIDDVFWGELKLVQQLLQPFAQAIHQLEADLPRLHQVYPIYHQLLEHVKNWEKQRSVT